MVTHINNFQKFSVLWILKNIFVLFENCQLLFPPHQSLPIVGAHCHSAQAGLGLYEFYIAPTGPRQMFFLCLQLSFSLDLLLIAVPRK